MEGSTLTLSCDYGGAALPGSGVSYIWYKDTAAISSEVSQTYAISSAAWTSGGSFTCEITVSTVTSDTSAGNAVTGKCVLHLFIPVFLLV